MVQSYVYDIYRCRNCEWEYDVVLNRIDYICLF